MLGHGNLGFGVPEDYKVMDAVQSVFKPLNRRSAADIDTMVEIFASDRIECDNHYEYFKDEMQSWVDRFEAMGDANMEIQNHHNDYWCAFQRAMNNMERVDA
jgi:hypothetical protein